MTFASNMQAVALRLLTKYGQSVSGTRVVEGVYNPNIGAAISETTTTYSGYAHPAPFTNAEIATGTVLASDVQLLLSTTTEPLVGDVITLSGVTYRVLSVGKVCAQAAIIIYKIQLRV